MFQFLLFSLLIFSNGVHVYSFSIPVVSDIQEMITMANDIQSVWAGNIPFKNLVTEVENPATLALEKLDSLSEQVSNLALELSDKMDNIVEELVTKIPLAQELSAAMRDFHNVITRVDLLYDDFQDFVGEDGFNSLTLNSLIKSVTSRDAGDIPDVVNQMHALFVPGRSASIRESILTLMVKAKSTSDDVCNPAFSFQERLYEIFNIVSLTEIRAFMMTLFAYDYLASTTNESYAKEVKKAQAKFVLRMEEYILTVRNKMTTVSRVIFPCDPPAWIRGETFVELEGLMTGYLMNEAQAYSDGTCSNSCSDIDATQTYGCFTWAVSTGGVGVYSTSQKFKYCPRRECLGRAYYCGSIGDSVEVCEYPGNSLRRYKYISGKSGSPTYGSKDGGCSGEGLNKTELATITPGFYKCDTCFCRCVEKSKESTATRAVSFLSQISDVTKNKVVTNFRFTEKNKMIYVQVEESELLPQLRVNHNESSWVPLEDYTYRKGNFYRVSDNKPLRENVEFAFIDDQRRTFNLDDIILPANHVLTGVRLNNVNPKDESSPIQLEVQATPVDDFNEGKIGKKESIWITPKSQPTPHKRYTEKRTEVDYGKKVDPRKSKKNGVFSKINEFIMVGPSNVNDDAGQTTIPLFDAQPVAVNRTQALGGAGLFVRGAKDYGGFLAFRAYTANLGDYMNANMKKKQLKNFKKLYREVLAFDPPTIK
ncbi:uncharacterized protein [Chelonus insularis]|uniref:uncharacterized protein n=1 Tax=Chelonus insularis TaxID=460826 RepID=UPI00158AF843|nr:uncharacterized protein LOC118064542 [Chelonus insularis]